MPQVIIEQPGVPAVTVPLSKHVIRFGRAEDNEVVLVAEEVSRHHAEVQRRGDNFVLLDKKSLNGTYVNRQKIVERPLTHMDEIWFGSKCRLVYRDDTSFGRDESHKHDSKLLQDVDKIREEMEQVGDNLTLIALAGRTPAPGGTSAMKTPPTARPNDLMAMSRAYRRLSALYKASKLIASDFDLSRRLSDVLDTAMGVMDADRGFVLLREQDGNLRVSVAREMGQDLAASSPSMGVAGKAAIDGEPVLMAGTGNELNLRESIIRQRITSAMAVPLKVEDRMLGSIYVDTRSLDVSFNEEDLELFASMAAQLAMAIDNVHLYQANLASEKKRSNLSRFLSPAIVDQIMDKDSELELGGSKRIVTTLFCDIRGFTPIAEKMPPHEMVELLNEHFSAMTQIVFNYKGTLDKYIGDEVMAVFGAPITAEDDALQAARAAVAIQAKNKELNALRFEEGRPRLDLGIGINTGEVIAGYMGSPMRMEFTVVGDHVNTARRLCDIAKSGQIIIGGSTCRQVKDHAETIAIGAVVLEGKANAVDAYELIGMKS